MSAPDLDGFDWDWWTRHEAEVMEALTQAFEAAYLAESPGAFLEAHEFAATYARTHGAELLAGLSAFSREEIGALIADAIESGATLSQLTAAIRESYVFSAVRAAAIAATETAFALGQGGLQAARAQKKTEKHWYSQGNARVCSRCVSNVDAGWVAIEADFPSGDGTIPAHPGCLPGDSLISSITGITAASKRWFDGDVSIIRTTSGRRLTATPNHPVLTPRGWIPAGGVNIGGYVISDGGSQWRSLSHSDHQDVPSRIEHVANAILGAGEMPPRPMPVSPEDFHGDGRGSQIAVVAANRQLRHGEYSSLCKHRREHSLAVGTLAITLSRLGLSNSFPLSGGTASRRLVCRGGLLVPLPGSHSRPLYDLGLGAVARRYSSIAQSPRDNRTADADLARQLIHGDACKVFADEIVDVQFGAFHGYVYNLQTPGGWYSADGIIVHNCHCNVGYRAEWAEPVKMSEVRCAECHKLLAKDAALPARVFCSRCKRMVDVLGLPALEPAAPAFQIEYDGWGRMKRVQLEDAR